MYDLNHPPLEGSGTASVKDWWRQLRLYGTPEQKRRFPEPTLPQGEKTTVPFEPQKSESFAEFLKREQAEQAAKSPQQKLFDLFAQYWNEVGTVNARHIRKQTALAYSQARTDGNFDIHMRELHDSNHVAFRTMNPNLAAAIRSRMHAEAAGQ